MKDRYGNTYHWCGKHLGNINYQGGPIKLANPEVGIDGLIGYLKGGYDLILLCQCAVLNDCHVKEVCRLLVEKMPEVEVVKFKESETKLSSLEGDVADLREIFEPERMIICQRSGPGKGCSMTWAVGDKVTCSIPWKGDVHGIVHYVKMEGATQKVQLRIAVYNPLAQSYIISDDKRWFDSENIKPRHTIIPELGERE